MDRVSRHSTRWDLKSLTDAASTSRTGIDDVCFWDAAGLFATAEMSARLTDSL